MKPSDNEAKNWIKSYNARTSLNGRLRLLVELVAVMTLGNRGAVVSRASCRLIFLVSDTGSQSLQSSQSLTYLW